MIFQRWYVVCPDNRASALEAACDAQIAPGWLRMVRGQWMRLGASTGVASLQATDAQGAQLLAIVALTLGVVTVRGPDDDGPGAGDALVDVGDLLPALLGSARYTLARVLSDLGLTPRPSVLT